METGELVKELNELAGRNERRKSNRRFSIKEGWLCFAGVVVGCLTEFEIKAIPSAYREKINPDFSVEDAINEANKRRACGL